MTTDTLLCLGSGKERRYRLDTLRALSLPSTARLQYRYTTDLIPEKLADELARNNLAGSEVLIGHVDCTGDPPQEPGPCSVYPCRFGRLRRSEKAGSIVILHFELGDFALASDFAAFQRSCGPNAPHWNQQHELSGFWCQRLQGQLEACRRTKETEDWQAIVERLHTSPDFRDEHHFLLIEGLSRCSKTIAERLGSKTGDVEVPATEGVFELKSREEYALRLLHFDPAADAHTGKRDAILLRATSDDRVLRVVSNPILAIDSPYDVKSVRLRAAQIMRDEWVSIVLGRISEKGELQPFDTELYLPVKVKGAIARTVLFGLAIGMLLALQQLVTTLNEPSDERSLGLAVAASALAVVTGLVAAFGTQRPL